MEGPEVKKSRLNIDSLDTVNSNKEMEFKLKMEENILRIYQELDKEKSESSSLDFSLRRSLKIRKFVEKMMEHVTVNHQMMSEIVSLKAKIVEVTEEHKASMLLNAKTMNSIVKMHEKAQEALEHKSYELIDIKQELHAVKATNQELLQNSKELIDIKQELQTVKATNQELLQGSQDLDMNENTFANIDSLERDHEIKPFSCKCCDKSFLHVHEVKKHIEIHTSGVEEEKTKDVIKNSRLLDHGIQEKKDVGNFEVNNEVLKKIQGLRHQNQF
mgnify:CR=1 FL=1